MYCVERECVEEECRFGARRILVYLMISLLLVDIILFLILVIWLATCSPSELGTTVPALPTPTPTTGLLFLPFKEAMKHCEMQNKTLPLPRDGEEEDDIFYAFRETMPEACDRAFLGFERAGYRYRSQVNVTTWVSLKRALHAGEALNRRFYRLVTIDNGEIHRLKIGNRKFGGHKENKVKNMLVMYRKEGHIPDCLKHMYKCVYLYQQDEEEKPVDVLENAKRDLLREKGMQVIGALPYDELRPPEGLVIEPNDTAVSDVFVVSLYYVLDYTYNNDRDKMKYSSTMLMVTDPEYNCLIYDRSRNNLLPHPCEDEVCVYCVDRTH